MSKNTKQPEYIYVLLEKPALHVWKEASKEGTSLDETVRGIIDKDLGFINLAKLRPADEREERIIKIKPSRPDTAHQLTRIPGVVNVASHIAKLAP